MFGKKHELSILTTLIIILDDERMEKIHNLLINFKQFYVNFKDG